MKNTVLSTGICCGVLFALTLAGCGGGGGSDSATSSATPTPSTTPTPATGIPSVNAQPTVTNTGVVVSWTRATGLPDANVIEYHIYRDDVLIGVTPPHLLTFTDTIAAPSSPSFDYSEVSNDHTGRILRTLPTSPVSTGVPHRYRITVVFTQSDPDANATPLYGETLIGVSGAVTP